MGSIMASATQEETTETGTQEIPDAGSRTGGDNTAAETTESQITGDVTSSEKQQEKEDSDDEGGAGEGSSPSEKNRRAPKESRHYQWAAEMKRRGEELERLGVSTAPKPISNSNSNTPSSTPSDKNQTTAESMSSYAGIPLSQAQGGSIWNTAGTWEDRDISSWATPELKERLKGLRFPVTLKDYGECVAYVRKVIRCSGSASIVYVRQKCKPGFEYHVEAKWGVAKPSQTEKADTDDEDEEVLAKGSVEFPDLADDAGGDYEWEIKTETTGSVAEECKNLIKSNKKAFEDLIQKWVEDMKR